MFSPEETSKFSNEVLRIRFGNFEEFLELNNITSPHLSADPVLLELPSLEEHGLEEVTPLAPLHDQILEVLVLEDAIENHEAVMAQHAHQLDLPLHAHGVLLLHLSLIIGLDDDLLP